MSKYQSMQNLKKAIGGGESFYGQATAIVKCDKDEYVYNDISIRVSYNSGYMQLDLSVIWEDDYNQVPYKQLGLHGSYNTTFQSFDFSIDTLRWRDENNEILLINIHK